MTRFVEYGFLLALIFGVGYVVWQMFMPFFGMLAMSLVIATLTAPFYVRFHNKMPWKSRGLSAACMVVVSYIIFLIPTSFLAYALIREARAIFSMLNNQTLKIDQYVGNIESFIHSFAPDLSLNFTSFFQSVASYLASNVTTVFTSAATTIAFLLIGMVVTFYLLRDGRDFMEYFIKMSPLQDIDDRMVLMRLTGAIRGVIFGVLAVAIIQAILTIIGLSVLGIERAVLFGALAAFGAMIPGVGSGGLVFTPLTIYLLATGQYGLAIGVAIWGATAVGMIDNLLGPYLMKWGGAALHPLLILLSVLGGIIAFGLVGFVVGPVALSLFKVLLEIYASHLVPAEQEANEMTAE